MAIIARNRSQFASRGQTVIETIFMLVLLLILFFLIAEFARAWYLKNSLNNAVRIAVRRAVVTPDLTQSGGFVDCPNANAVIDAVCSSPGVPDDDRTSVRIERTEDVDPTGGVFTAGDTVTVSAISDFQGIAFGFVLPEFAASAASMRYE